MTATAVLLDLLVVLVAAKVAAEAAERVALPAVVGEILAGIAIGPSVLGLVGRNDEVLRVLGELGVILLLLEVGLQLDIGELRSVGRSSLAVAVIGVTVPFVLGWAAASALGHTGSTAVFVGAALTATSVGITARVFADLRALVTPEARTVLGAAVADDVIGLVVLTVVVRLTTGGSVTVLSVLGVVAVALAFLAIASGVGVRLAPVLFGWVHRLSRSPGTVLALALAFTLGIAELADAARLAPIVGAFVAGLALSRADQSDRIRHEVAPISHVFVPVFFLQIGIDADISAFAKPAVLAVAGGLLAAAVVGKLVASVGAIGAPGDKLLIGLGMLPRGEVGLIFATIGLREGVLGEDLYAALLLVVLATTLLAPPLLRRRITTLGPSRAGAGGERVSLDEALKVARDAARSRAEPSVLEGLAALGAAPVRWDGRARRELYALLADGNARSWRVLDTTGVLERALPDVAKSFRHRRDPFDLDPVELPTLDAVRDLLPDDDVPHPERLLLAALVLDAATDESAVVVARRLLGRLDAGAGAEQDVAFLVGDAGLLRLSALRAGSFDEEHVLQLATHIERRDRLRMLHLLSRAIGDLDHVARARLDELATLVDAVLADPDTGDRATRNLIERRRLEATRLAGGDPVVAERLVHAPRAYLVSQPPIALARQARLLEPVPARGNVRVAVTPIGEGEWRVDVAGRDRPGLLAAITGALLDAGDVVSATIATWPDGGALESFLVRATEEPDASAISGAVDQLSRGRLAADPRPDARVTFDDASPWHTRIEVRVADRPGLLHQLAVGLAAAGCDVHAARVETRDGEAVDRFDVTDRKGRKLDDRGRETVDRVIRAGVKGRANTTLTETKQSGNGGETSASYGAASTSQVQKRRHVCEGEQSDSPV